MKTIWKLQAVKTRFSKIVADALKKGPQYVTRRGEKTVVAVSVNDYEELISSKPSFKDFSLGCPKIDGDFEIERQKDSPTGNNVVYKFTKTSPMTIKGAKVLSNLLYKFSFSNFPVNNLSKL